MSQPEDFTVLLIDNDEGVLMAMQTRLEERGFRCRTAQTGAQGLAEFEMGGVDLVITDLVMPTLDGFGVVKHVRRLSGIPIIVITGFQHEYRCSRQLRTVPNVQVVGKPFSARDMIDVVEAELYLSGSYREAA